MSDYTTISKDFFKALTEGEFIGSKCLDCGAVSVPPRHICSKCHSVNSEIITLSGKGTLAAYTVISVPPVMMANAGHDGKNPYCVGIVALEEGARISAQILEVDMNTPETIKIGTPLTMTPIIRGEGEAQQTFLAFKPA
jgi:uncharacterized OB-fold protein